MSWGGISSSVAQSIIKAVLTSFGLVIRDGSLSLAYNNKGDIIKSDSDAAVVSQYAVDQMPVAASQGGELAFGNGTFDLSSAGLIFDISTQKYRLIKGIGSATDFKWTGAGYVMTLNGSTSGSQEAYFEKFRIRTLSAVVAGRHGILDQSIQPMVFFEKIQFRDLDDALSIINSNSRHLRDLQFFNCKRGLVTQAGANSNPNAIRVDRFFASLSAGQVLFDIGIDKADTTATTSRGIGILHGQTGGGDIVCRLNGKTQDVLLEDIYSEFVSDVDYHLAGKDSSNKLGQVVSKVCGGNGGGTRPYMFKLDFATKVVLEEPHAINYTTALVLLNRDIVYELLIINPHLETTPFLLDTPSNAFLTSGDTRCAGRVIEGRNAGSIVLLPTGYARGDVVKLGSAGRYVAITAAGNEDNPAVVMYPSTNTDRPGVIYDSGIFEVNCNGAVAVSDTLVTENAASKKAMVNNAQTDPKKIIGYAVKNIAGAGLTLVKKP